ncbi:helix-turn-helix domain-containing protein [Companilactobacillus mishanensis]|uniref:Helix-turn-helix transcriptional regulator n=1 Tax=Companilactobacillus mishanensis TaxID=2486008 RepID=A0ABW9P3W6_9LACO|nr:helix-turn-helix transcriptional regulator [Companilactobacillus mishanensis]MQS43954.1 helix-turn-helix transcriptional regulator [Companilactobacillus mishanensis]
MNAMNRTKKLREEKGIKLVELSKATNIHRSTLSRYENHITEIGSKKLFELANYFHVSMEYLGGYSNERNR